MGEDRGRPRAARNRAQTPQGGHTPVLLQRCLDLLGPGFPDTDGLHVDATLGLGGHAEAVLQAFPSVRLIGLDRDPQALELATRRLAPFADRIHLVHAVYDQLAEVLRRLGYAQLNAVLFDLGVSSMQLDEAARGFSYSRDAPLDMRMDPTTGITAEEIVNSYPAAELIRILREYGEERFAPRIAAAIVRDRAKARITSTAHLAELVTEAVPAAKRRTGGHPAKRTFQALRIEVNAELAALEAALPQALDALAPGGRIVVMAYQSLEDRIVKRELARRAHSSGPIDLPVELPGTGPTLRLLTRGAEQADPAEVAANPRAASVRLRAAQRIDRRGRTDSTGPGGAGPTRGLHQPSMLHRAPRTRRAIEGDRDEGGLS